MYRYETHMHTFPVSRCARADVRESLEFYKSLGYDGVCITNHFLDGNINIERDRSYAERIEFYFSDYEAAVEVGKELGIKVFCGVEISYKGTDFLIYGLDKAWYLAHPEIMSMKKTEELALMMEQGALVIQAHPYREADYIDHIRLFPRSVHGVEVINANQNDGQNGMAKIYADHYGLLAFAGSDNHTASRCKRLAGVCFDSPIDSMDDFIKRVKDGAVTLFTMENGEEGWHEQSI